MPECTEGRVATTESAGRCCWPGQTWARDLGRCDGPPSCPAGLAGSGDSCIPPLAATAPAAPIAPALRPIDGPRTRTSSATTTTAASFVLERTYDEPLLLQYEDPDRPRRDRWVRLCTLPCDVDLRPGYRLGVGALDRGVARFPSDYRVQPGERVSVHYLDRRGARTAGVVVISVASILGAGGVLVGALGTVFRWSSGVIIAGFAAGGGVLLLGLIVGGILAAQGDGVDVQSVRFGAAPRTWLRAAVEPDTLTDSTPAVVSFDL